MDPLQEENNPEDNVNSGSLGVKIKEENTSCPENNSPDEKDVTTSSLITDANNSPPQEFKCETVENDGHAELSNVVVPKRSAEDIKSVTASFLITDDAKNSPQEESKDDPENNNPVEFLKSSEEIKEEGKLHGDVTVTEIMTSVNVTVRRETDVNDASASLSTDENNVSRESFIAAKTEEKGSPLEQVPEITTELSTEDKNPGENHEELNTKDDSDDDSVDSSSDSSSSSSSASSTSGSSSNDEMDVDNNDDADDDAVVELPKKLSPVIEEKPEELKAIQENPSIPDFPAYRDNEGGSFHDSSSEDSTSSLSDVDDDDTADQAPKQKSRSRKNSESEERSRPRIKGEIFPEELPALENLNICVGDDVDLQMLGKITSVIMNIAVVRAEFASPIDQDSFVFLKDRTCVGKVHDIIGPVLAPFYTVLLDKDNVSIAIDTEIYCAPKEEEYTKYVFVSDLRNLKGSDASWENDIEPPNTFLDYSDDEQERVIRKHNKCKNSNGKPQQKDKSASGWPNTSRTKKWRKSGNKSGANSNTFPDASPQKSMFACNMAWPPNNSHGSFPSWPPPTPPPMPPTPPPAHFQQPNNPTFYPNGQPSHPTWHSNYQQPPNPPVGMMMQQPPPPPQQPPQQHRFQSPWNPHQNPSNMDPYQHQHPHHPQSRPPFIAQPPNQQPWFRGQWRPPYNPQGPPRHPGSFDYMRYPLPRFSQPPQFPGFYP